MTQTAKIYSSRRHRIPVDRIDPDALKVMATLRKAGYLAYLVGGSVRDLLIGRTPKDYDISTSAKPEEIKSLFRNCLLIGRRFRLAHIRMNKKVFEVSTFRSGDLSNQDLILRDNQWGSPEEDALRRDFTINGLFYNPEDNTVIDYVNAWEDIQKGVLKSIGNACTRFKQDPVRMLRLIKFKARFKFDLEESTEKALKTCKKEILKSSPARVLEEILRMLESGYAAEMFHLLYQQGLIQILLPSIGKFLKTADGTKIFNLLDSADRLVPVETGQTPNSRAVLFACLLYPILDQRIQTEYLSQDQAVSLGTIQKEIEAIIQEIVNSFFLFPKKLRSSITFILLTQYRLTPLQDKKRTRLHRLMKNCDFSLALKMLKMRAYINPEYKSAYNRWKKNYFLSSKEDSNRKHKKKES